MIYKKAKLIKTKQLLFDLHIIYYINVCLEYSKILIVYLNICLGFTFSERKEDNNLNKEESFLIYT